MFHSKHKFKIPLQSHRAQFWLFSLLFWVMWQELQALLSRNHAIFKKNLQFWIWLDMIIQLSYNSHNIEDDHINFSTFTYRWDWFCCGWWDVTRNTKPLCPLFQFVCWIHLRKDTITVTVLYRICLISHPRYEIWMKAQTIFFSQKCTCKADDDETGNQSDKINISTIISMQSSQ